MNIFDGIEKLINEHGSASILRDHVALFKDQLSILKEKFTVLETNNKNLETENQNLKSKNKELQKKIQIYEQSTHDILLENIEIKILKSLAKSKNVDIKPEQLSKSVHANLQIITFHLENLKTKGLIENRPIAPFDYSPNRFWSLSQEGRRYLIKHKLIS